MIESSTLDALTLRLLNQHIFDKVWNEPVSEYRENIHPYLLMDRSQVAYATLLYGTLKLPDTMTPYYVYGISDTDLCIQLPLSEDSWMSAEQLCNHHHILITMYDYKGHVYHKNQVWFRYGNKRTSIYIAVSKSMAKLMTPHVSMTDVYFTVYLDSDTPNDITVSSFRVYNGAMLETTKDNINKAYAAIEKPEHATLYVNGVERSIAEYRIAAGDYVDVINDKNVICEYTVDLTEKTARNYYISSIDEKECLLVHTPKALNPEQKVLTHNTCEFHVRGKQSKTGRYIHRAGDICIHQVTHQDFALPKVLLEAYADYMEDEEQVLRVQIRQHNKDNLLLRDKSYIDLLYTHDDSTIIEFLIGNKSKTYPQLDFWKATNLEQSLYLKMMFDVPDVITPATIDYYVDGLGYYHVLSLLCERVINSIITDAVPHSFVYTKPYLYRGNLVYPVVYLNGNKIPSTSVDVTAQDEETITIDIKPEIYRVTGDTLTVIFFLDGRENMVVAMPTLLNSKIEVPYTSYRIYQRRDTFIQGYKGVDATSSIQYIDITDKVNMFTTETTSTGHLLICGEQMFGKKYLIQNSVVTYAWDVNIDTLVSVGKNIVIPLERTVSTTDDTVYPILNFKNESIYLNGKYLIKGLDYTIAAVKAGTDISFYQLVIQTFDYMKDTENTVSIVLNGAEREDASYGFVLGDMASDVTPANLWFPSISTCHVNGKLEWNVINRGIHIQLPAGKYKNGTPFEIQTAVPTLVIDYLNKYHKNDDKERLEILNAYFYGKVPSLSEPIIVPGQHRVYSTFLNSVVYDIIVHDKQFAIDPDVTRQSNQLVDYDYLKAYDVTMQSVPLDARFVDVYGPYVTFHGTYEQHKLIQSILDRYLSKDAVRSGADYYG